MNILVIGSGGREHAIVWKLRQSPSAGKIWCAPGNGGIASEAECLALDVSDVKAAADLASRLGADLTIVGPELPLVRGIADEFRRRGLALLGPSQQGAQLEGSKVFAKKFMERHAIPAPALYGAFDFPVDAYAALCSVDWPLVVKADGLCAGKGVLVTSSPDAATAFIGRLMESDEFGAAGKQVLLEEGLSGPELSYIILTDGRDFISLAPSRDHKRAFDGDAGPNTGGMGAYSADELLPAELEKVILETIVRPTLAGLAKDGIEYRGFLYFGMMLTPDGPKVLEFNCRLGDPETQAILLRADFDLAEACAAAARG
ncbi:MAG: phosphoribosylamine--glycine ligase, partial [Candidatus Acidiferrales bacterium]